MPTAMHLAATQACQARTTQTSARISPIRVILSIHLLSHGNCSRLRGITKDCGTLQKEYMRRSIQWQRVFSIELRSWRWSNMSNLDTRSRGGPLKRNSAVGALTKRRFFRVVARDSTTQRCSHKVSSSIGCVPCFLAPASMMIPPSNVLPWHAVEVRTQPCEMQKPVR